MFLEIIQWVSCYPCAQMWVSIASKQYFLWPPEGRGPTLQALYGRVPLSLSHPVSGRGGMDGRKASWTGRSQSHLCSIVKAEEG